ncbi:MAG: cytidylate kinase-like family protein [Clostridiales bacterium]|jgi:cytidylate kinase|nr:cytidylate kinase-like family protein [Clostridiales bacterium]
MNIITVSREFGSGGREIGKRLADALNIAYLDREIVSAIAEKSSLDESYVDRNIESGLFKMYPVTFSRTFTYMPVIIRGTPDLLAQQHKVIKELAAKGDCVIVGRGADEILREYRPFKVFVYADMPAKLERCRKRAAEDEKLSDRELEKSIKQIDKARADNHNLISSFRWGDKSGYHLCVNTTGIEIKSVVPHIAAYAAAWFKTANTKEQI